MKQDAIILKIQIYKNDGKNKFIKSETCLLKRTNNISIITIIRKICQIILKAHSFKCKAKTSFMEL